MTGNLPPIIINVEVEVIEDAAWCPAHALPHGYTIDATMFTAAGVTPLGVSSGCDTENEGQA